MLPRGLDRPDDFASRRPFRNLSQHDIPSIRNLPSRPLTNKRGLAETSPLSVKRVKAKGSLWLPPSHHENYAKSQTTLRENNYRQTYGNKNPYRDGGLVPVGASPPYGTVAVRVHNDDDVPTGQTALRRTSQELEAPPAATDHPAPTEHTRDTASSPQESSSSSDSPSGSLNALSSLDLCSPNLIAPLFDEPLFSPSPPPSPQNTTTFKVEDDQPSLLLDSSPFVLNRALLGSESPDRVLEADTAVTAFMGTLSRKLDSVSTDDFDALGIKSEQDLDFLCSLGPEGWRAMGDIAFKKLSVKQMEWLHIEMGLSLRRKTLSPLQARRTNVSLHTSSCDVWTFLHTLRKPLTEHHKAFKDAGICHAVDLDLFTDRACQDRMRETPQLQAIKELDWFYIKDGLQERAKGRNRTL